jgi:hypothetical protein
MERPDNNQVVFMEIILDIGSYPAFNERKKADWIGHIFVWNCLLKHAVEGHTETRIELRGRQGRTRKHLHAASVPV